MKIYERSINFSLSGRFSNPFRKLSLACCRSNSSWADCIALILDFFISSLRPLVCRQEIGKRDEWVRTVRRSCRAGCFCF